MNTTNQVPRTISGSVPQGKRVKFWTRIKHERYEEWKLIDGKDPFRAACTWVS